jgi:hypothetical protein
VSYSYYWGIIVSSVSNTQISQSVLRDIYQGATLNYGIYLYAAGPGNKIFNNIIYDFKYSGIADSGATGEVDIYNNTVVNSTYCFWMGSGVSALAKNNIAQNCTGGFANTFASGSDYNISNEAVYGAPGAHSKTSTIVAFVDANNKDFHLASTDTAAKNSGADLAADTNLAITNDIDGSTRPTGANVVDIGADEASTSVFYSVGQNTSNHCGPAGDGNSCGNVSITSGVATFTAVQAGTNLGVGDKLVAGGNTYYLSSKSDSSHWSVITALGAVPSNLGSTAVTSISHAFASLHLAVDSGHNGAGDSSHLNTLNLVTGNYVINIPTYYDSGADTTGVTINGWTTNASNYIKIYTPYNTLTEVNQTQRHSGKWDGSKYNMSLGNGDNQAIYVNNNDIWIDGLQILRTVDSGYGRGIFTTGISGFKISNCIVKASLSGSASSSAGIYLNGASGGKVWNNIVYGYLNGAGAHQGFVFGSTNFNYAYNNTSYANYEGYTGISSGSNIVLKNNVAYNNTDNYRDTFSASSTNNLSGPGTDAQIPATNKRDGVAVSFVSTTAGSEDLHLAFTDAGAKGWGTNLSADTYLAFSNDIDSQERTGTWAIGADEPIEAVMQSPTLERGSITNGLVLYQSFDGADINGTTSYDRSGQNNNGTILNGATAVIGERGQALKFDGIDDKITFSYPPISNTFTLSLWIKPNSGGNAYQSLIFENTTRGLYWSGSFGKISYYDTQADHRNDHSITTNQWHHVVVASDAGVVTFYIDAVSDGGFSGANTFSPNNIGFDTTNEAYSGLIDEVRIYNRALSVDEIGDLYRLGQDTIGMSQTNKNTNGLVGMWSFDGADINGTNAYDRSGSGNNGTISGAVPAIGKKGQALKFNGTSDFVSVASNDNLEFGTGDFTISYWIKWSSTGAGVGGYQCSQDGGYAGDNGVLIEYDAGARVRVYFGTTFVSGILTWAYTPNIWYHHVLSRTGTDVKFFVNGTQLGATATSNKNIHKDTLLIGKYSGGEWLNGYLDEYRIYNRALSADEVGDLYRLGTATMKR